MIFLFSCDFYKFCHILPMKITIKTALEQIIEQRFNEKSDVIFVDYIENEEISLEHASSFIKGRQTMKKEHFENFLDEMKYFGIDVKMEGRNAKIEARVFKNDFLKLEIDLEDYTYIQELFKYLFILAVEDLQFIRTQEEIEIYKKNKPLNEEEFPLKETFRCIQVDNTGRKELLVRRIKPTMSLDEYADMVMDNLRKREEYEKKQEFNKKTLTDLEIYEKELQEFREMDEFKDNLVPGNTYRRA